MESGSLDLIELWQQMGFVAKAVSWILFFMSMWSIGVAVEPTGAFYVLANARRYTGDSLAFAFDILERTHVAVTPGVDFGRNAEGYLRFAYANSLARIEEALVRLGRFLSERP